MQEYNVTYQNDDQTFTLRVNDTTIVAPKLHGTFPITASPIVSNEDTIPQPIAEKAKEPPKQTKEVKEPPKQTKKPATRNKKAKSAKGKISLPLQRWHERLGHLNYDHVRQLADSETAVHLSTNKQTFCEPCTFGKQRTKLSHKQQERANAKLDFIHIDLAGGKSSLTEDSDILQIDLFDDEDIPPTQKGSRYFMLITDDYSRYRWFFAMKYKSEAYQLIEDWVTLMQN